MKHRLTDVSGTKLVAPKLVLTASRSRNEINGGKIDVVLSLLISLKIKESRDVGWDQR